MVQHTDLLDILHDPLLSKPQDANAPTKPQAKKPFCDLVWGYLSLLAVVLTWTAQSEVCQLVQVDGYNKPMGITWINHSASVVIIPMLILAQVDVRGSFHVLFGRELTKWRVWWQAFMLSVVFLAADWVWYLGLPCLSVAMGTVVFSSSPAWVYLISVCMGQKVQLRKIVALVVCLAGVAVIFVRKGHDNVSLDHEPVPMSVEIMGNVLVLGAAVGYAVYQVIFDKTMAQIGTDNIWTINVFVGVMGVFNVFLLWPVLFLVSIPALPTEIREVPQIPSWATFAGLAINASLALAFNISFALATVRMGPFLTSVATVLTIPLTMVVDAVLHGDHFGCDACVGSLLVLSGFVGLVASS
mmetsp:Transcript_8288/g.23016  ORF Transcript_8288/g.23016 Transcript_8288/m.23016 type:complete len:356 (-) Transcript_8288:164-1231(-)|eukprot:CAMPEP_0194484962 /NCGR_PEP_ID=MMETSP0253-20130528/6109_1 /TAXON_ID=2966 /ORGANISM="Noctiluca scintillans" /LENGTH=355 /DNA_ID=CAMNT_0039324847 /DNA_START=61 /DNA_END=1128 /DNA_ORIENTATION=-